MGTHVDRALKRRWAAEKSGMRLGGSHTHTRTHTHAHPSPTTPLGIKSPCHTQDAPTGFEPGWAASPLRALPLSHWLVRKPTSYLEPDCSTSTSLSAPSDSRRARSRRLARSRGSHRGSDDRDQPSSSLACRVAARRPPRPRAARQEGASYGRIQELVAAAFPGPDAWTVDSSIAWWAPEDQNN